MKIDFNEHGNYYDASGQEIAITETMIQECLKDCCNESAMVPAPACFKNITLCPNDSDLAHVDQDTPS